MSAEIQTYQDPRLQPMDPRPDPYEAWLECPNSGKCWDRWKSECTDETLHVWEFCGCSLECERCA